jgi:mannose-1-phosphate guanylyltransferase
MEQNYYAVIMAGGGGTRLWPLSRKDKPKQLVKLDGENTLFQIAVERLLGLFPAERIMVITSQSQADVFQQDTPIIPQENYVIEPSGRDTAAAIGLAAVALRQRDPQAVMAVVTADHFIEREGRFLHVLRAAYQVAEEDYLVTLGIQPTFPSTGFGYIQQGAYLGTYEDIIAFKAESFKEKPDEETAREFIEREDHSWNSGMFIWRVANVLAEIERQMPQLHQALTEISAAFGTDAYQQTLARVWDGLKKISIDFGIMEGAKSVAVIPARGLGWSDVGNWNAVHDVLTQSAEGNVIVASDHIVMNTEGSLIFKNGGHRRLIVALGVKDLVIADMDNVLLVCDKNAAQDVRQVVQKLKEEGKTEYL